MEEDGAHIVPENTIICSEEQCSLHLLVPENTVPSVFLHEIFAAVNIVPVNIVPVSIVPVRIVPANIVEQRMFPTALFLPSTS